MRPVTSVYPAKLVAAQEDQPQAPDGSGERFRGYGVMSCPFVSGHVLALRRFAATSVGPAYTSVWHRDPAGRWRFYQDLPATGGCSRYFGPALAGTVECAITLEWSGDYRLDVSVDAEPAISWEIDLATTVTTRLLNGLGRLIPEDWWTSPAVLAAMSKVATASLRAGRIQLSGRAPNGQRFEANPRLMWTIRESRAFVGGEDFGPVGHRGPQSRLGDFWIPTRGLFAIGDAFFDRGVSTGNAQMETRS